MRPCWLLGLALLSGGCGVSGYEERMAQSQKALERHEEEGRLLEGPTRGPEKANKDNQKQPVANVFLRLPKGFSTTPVNEDSPRGGMLYTYYPRDPERSPFVFAELATFQIVPSGACTTPP